MIAPIAPLPGLASVGGIGGAGTGLAGGASSAGGAGSAGSAGGSFGNAVTHAIDSLQQVQNNASLQATQAAAGQGNVTDALIASSQASLSTQVTTAVTNKAIEAFNSIMTMSL
jgi:flagellar hook-basal body complex protein FliE